MAESEHSDADRRLELKKKLLRKAFDGNSKLSPPEMIALIERITQENRNGMPEGHAEILAELQAEDEEAAARGEKVSRSVKQLNAQARHAGLINRFKDNAGEDDAPEPEPAPPQGPPSAPKPTLH